LTAEERAVGEVALESAGATRDDEFEDTFGLKNSSDPSREFVAVQRADKAPYPAIGWAFRSFDPNVVAEPAFNMARAAQLLIHVDESPDPLIATSAADAIHAPVKAPAFVCPTPDDLCAALTARFTATP
jgi:hypothetical protein